MWMVVGAYSRNESERNSKPLIITSRKEGKKGKSTRETSLLLVYSSALRVQINKVYLDII